MNLTIAWLYPELMSTYGDRGNIITIKRRAQWRNIEVNIKKISIDSTVDEIQSCDFLFMGGAQDRQQKIVSLDLKKKQKAILDMAERNIPGLYICGAFQFLGNYYKEADGSIIDGLKIFDMHTVNSEIYKNRLIGNVILKTDVKYLNNYEFSKYLVGFENHGGRTYLGKNTNSFAKVIKGFGNNGEDTTEGAIYKNYFGTYLHGPILPKNPHFADYLLTLALEVKYKKKIKLLNLNDTLEKKAHILIAKRLGVEL